MSQKINGSTGTGPAVTFERGIEAALDCRAFGQRRQLVVGSAEVEIGFGEVALVDVAQRPYHAADVRIVEQVGHCSLMPAADFACLGRDDPHLDRLGSGGLATHALVDVGGRPTHRRDG